MAIGEARIIGRRAFRRAALHPRIGVLGEALAGAVGEVEGVLIHHRQHHPRLPFLRRTLLITEEVRNLGSRLHLERRHVIRTHVDVERGEEAFGDGREEARILTALQ